MTITIKPNKSDLGIPLVEIIDNERPDVYAYSPKYLDFSSFKNFLAKIEFYQKNNIEFKVEGFYTKRQDQNEEK